MKTINHIYTRILLSARTIAALTLCIATLCVATLGLVSNNSAYAMRENSSMRLRQTPRLEVLPLRKQSKSLLQNQQLGTELPALKYDMPQASISESTALVPYRAEQPLAEEPYIAELLEATPAPQLPIPPTAPSAAVSATLPIAQSLNASPEVVKRLEQINMVNTKLKEFQEIKDNPAMLMFALKTLTQLIMTQAPHYGAAAASITASVEALYPLLNNLSQLLIAKGILSSTPNQEVVIDALNAISKAIDQKLEYNQDYVLSMIALAIDFIETKATKSWPQESGTLKTAAQNLNTLVAALNTPDNKEAIQNAYDTLQAAQKAINATSYYAPDKRADLPYLRRLNQ